MSTYRVENELQTRNRIVRNHIKDKPNCIVLKIDTVSTSPKNINPFGFHFELDKKRYEERKRQLRRERITQWFSWIAYYHHKFGIRHILLVLMLSSYVFVGGAIFDALEAPRELEDLKETIVKMNAIIYEETSDVINMTLSYNGTVRNQKIARSLKRFYKTMLEEEGRFHGSVWHKAENLEMRLTWHFSSATFYCMTLFTTIGYGSIACQTVWGRVLSVIYTCLGIPLMLVVLGDLGEWFQKSLTKLYLFSYMKYRSHRNKPSLTDEQIEETVLPIWLAVPIVGIYVVSCALFIRMFDHNEGQLPGIGFGDAFYFTFISLTTIGLGDIMPYNIQYSPFLSTAFLLGLTLVSIVNTSIYAQCYDSFFNAIHWMENNLESIHKRNLRRGQGYRVFKDMEPGIQLLVCSFPHLGNNMREGALEGILRQADAPKAKKKVTYSNAVRERTFTYTPENEDGKEKTKPSARIRAPTLGAFGGMELAKFRKPEKDNSARRNSGDFGGIVDLSQWKKKIEIPDSLKTRRLSDADTKADIDISQWNITPRKKDEPKEEPETPEPSDVEAEAPDHVEVEVVDETSDASDDAGTSEEAGPSVEDLYGDGPSDSRERSSTITSTSSDLPPEDRPAPLLELPVLPPPSGSDEDSDDDWAPPPSKFMQLKRGSYFVPRTEHSDDDDDEGPPVEYIPRTNM